MNILEILKGLAYGSIKNNTTFESTNQYYNDLYIFENKLYFWYEDDEFIHEIKASDIIEMIEDNVIFNKGE